VTIAGDPLRVKCSGWTTGLCKTGAPNRHLPEDGSSSTAPGPPAAVSASPFCDLAVAVGFGIAVLVGTAWYERG